MTSTISKTLAYPMIALSFSKIDWDDIMSPILKFILPKAGINRNFSRHIVLGPHHYYCLNVMHPYHDQHLSQLTDLLEHMNTRTSYSHTPITADLIADSTQTLRIEAGVSGPLTNIPNNILQLCTPTWLNALLIYATNIIYRSGII